MLSSDDSVREAHARIQGSLGVVTHLVCGSGLNTKKRYWRDQSMSEFEAIVQTNLVGAVRVIDAALPGMRAQAGGVVVLVSSYAGWTVSPNAGVAYTATKTALGTLASTVNAQEGGAGIRCCHLCPGDTATDFLQLRPQVPDGEAQQRMLTAGDVARAVQFVLDSPPHVTIDELVITPVSLRR